MKQVLIAVAAMVFAAPAMAANGGMAGMSNMLAAGQSAMVMAHGEGVITAINAKAGTVTIHHGPIAALKWPAMTMTFKANPTSLLNGFKVGQNVRFTLMQMNGATTLTGILHK